MRTPRNDLSAAPHDSPQERLRRVLSITMALLGGMLIVARPLGNQLAHFAPDAAFANLLSALFVCVAGLRAAFSKDPSAAPENLLLAAMLWIALYVLGALRAPFLGASVSLSSDAILYVLVLLGGYFAGRCEPALRGIFMRAIIAIVVVEAFAAMWQVTVDLPRLRQLIGAGEAVMPDALNSKIGLDRLNGDDAFATFGNPNSLAAYLLVGVFLLLGHVWSALFTKKSFKGWLLSGAHIFVVAMMLIAMYWTGSKGGGVAFLFGCWFFALQRLNTRLPMLNTLTIAGLFGVLTMLVLGYFEIVPSRYYGLSMQVRFEYWKSAMAMFVRHPLSGVGVGGFAEWFSTFKTPLGWESKDPHCEVVSMLAELGVLGPIVYGLIWRLVLRNSGKVQPKNDELICVGRAMSWRDSAALVPIAGAACLLLFIGSFGVFNASDIFSLLQGEADKLTALCALQTLFLPVLFVLVYASLHGQSKWRSADPNKTDVAMLHGFRAAAGAVLMHQLVDFDFKAQAVMVSLFLCGGTFWGSADSSVIVAEESRSRIARGSGWMVAALGLLILPTAFWIPFYSGMARTEAQELQSYLQLIKAHPEKSRGDLSPDETKSAILSARLRAVESAPFDSEALVDRAMARLALEPHEPFGTNENEILELLNEAVALRPLATQSRVLIGSVYLHRALAAPENEKRAHFKRSREAFSKTRQLYPLHPGFAFMEGDVWLLMGEPEKACEDYGEAFEIDMTINDPNVYISAIFSDPRPGAFSRHGLDAKVLDAIDMLPHSHSKALSENARRNVGLLARRASAIANLLNEREKSGTKNDTLATRLKDALYKTTLDMSVVAAELPTRAHAALLHTLCVKKLNPELFDTAREYARRLQDESVRAGTPGTLPSIFKDLMPK